MIGLSNGWLTFFLATMLGIAYLDYSTGKDLAVWGLYLIPVAAASWMGGFRAGLILSIASCVLMFIAGTYGGTMFASKGFFLLGILNRLIAFLMVSWLAAYLFRRQMLDRPCVPMKSAWIICTFHLKRIQIWMSRILSDRQTGLLIHPPTLGVDLRARLTILATKGGNPSSCAF